MTLAACLVAVCLAPQGQPELRAPSIPLLVHDPYFSIWLPHDRPADGESTHWTGRPQPLRASVAVDGERRRLLGAEPKELRAWDCRSTAITPTRTRFGFEDARVALELEFLSPALPDDLDVLSRPLSYLVWTATSRDGLAHRLELEFSLSTLVCVDRAGQAIATSRPTVAGLDVAVAGSVEQAVLGARGDDRRIDWGYAWLAQRAGTGAVTADGTEALRAQAVLEVAASGAARHAMLIAYDDVRAIRYFDEDLPAYWRRDPKASAERLLVAGAAEFERLDARCLAFDRELMATATALGGARHAQLCALAYRQALGGNRLCADRAGRPLLFPKENFSNGCIATVDVIYPMAPLFLLLGADLAKAMLVPPLDYGSSARWRFPFAPHDLGTYPHATGQVYGGGERDATDQMPVEESANLLLLVTAVAVREGHAGFAKRWRPTLARWAAYLEAEGFDPESQLCTDDFTGHLAHNVNLSAKAILALAAFGRLCALDGRHDEAERWRAVARDFAARWVEAAIEGERSRLAFDRPQTWSQKYNLVWDRILGLGVFPAELLAREVAAYRGLQNRYGLPLDSRATFTKNDWILWSACLSGERADFDALVAPVWDWVQDTPDRVPLSDWYDTVSGRQVGFVARPVVGGFFMRFLADETVWRRWFERGVRGADDWAPLPLAVLTELVPASIASGQEWRATTVEPAAGWERPDFDDAAWSRGLGGFGTAGTPGAVVRSPWQGPAIWLRRRFTLDADHRADERLRLLLHHDEDVEVWIDGVLALRAAGYTVDYQRFPIAAAARARLSPGEHVIALRCVQSRGGQYVDLGIVALRLPD
jgi:hypothetical protein